LSRKARWFSAIFFLVTSAFLISIAAGANSKLLAPRVGAPAAAAAVSAIHRDLSQSLLAADTAGATYAGRNLKVDGTTDVAPNDTAEQHIPLVSVAPMAAAIPATVIYQNDQVRPSLQFQRSYEMTAFAAEMNTKVITAADTVTMSIVNPDPGLKQDKAQ
jgi:hypothetical protein